MKRCRKSTNISCLLVQVQSMKEELQKKNNTKQTCRRRAECESRAGKQIGKAAAVRRCRWNLPLLRLTTLCSSGCRLHQSQGNRFTTLCSSVRSLPFHRKHSALVFVAYHSIGNSLLQWLQPTGPWETHNMVRFTVYTGETQRQSQIYYNFEETNSSPQVHRKHTQLFMALTRKAAMDIGQSSQML